MRVTEQIDIFGTRDAGIVEIDISGWVTPDTVSSLNLAIKSFDHQVKGMIFDYRGAIVALEPDHLRLFTHIPDCPIAHLVAPMHDPFAKHVVTSLRSYGYQRTKSYSREAAERWLLEAIKQSK